VTDPVGDLLRQGASAAQQEQERARAVSAVLAQAPNVGLDEAIARFGQRLSQADQDLIRSLTREELSALQSTQGKLGDLTTAAAARNNNNNYI